MDDFATISNTPTRQQRRRKRNGIGSSTGVGLFSKTASSLSRSSSSVGVRRRGDDRFATFASSSSLTKFAVLLSAAVLVAYGLSIVGVAVVLDGQRDGGNIDKRHLNIRGGGSTSVYKRNGGGGGGAGALAIPTAKWPMTLRDESDIFESIPHPVDASVKIRVPKFWSRPVDSMPTSGKAGDSGSFKMPRETAMQIG